MAAFVQRVSLTPITSSGSASITFTVGTNTSAHNTVFVAWATTNTPSGGATRIVDSKGHIWVRMRTATPLNLYRAANGATPLTTGDTITITYGGSASIVAAAAEYVTNSTTTGRNGTNLTSGTGRTAAVSSATGTTPLPAVAIGVMFAHKNMTTTPTTPTRTPTGTFTHRFTVKATIGLHTQLILDWVDRTIITSGTYGLTWHWTPSMTRVAVLNFCHIGAPANTGGTWFPLLWERGG